MLRFFDLDCAPDLSAGAAGWEIGRLFDWEPNRELWTRYVYLTQDFDGTSPDLKPYDRAALAALVMPDGSPWPGDARQAREEIAAQILKDASPFDAPQPAITFAGKVFLFTGKFEFGTRTKCQQAVRERGGVPSESESADQLVDYLVVGAKGNPTWAHDGYGRKIEAAVVSRRSCGLPAIVSEAHWRASLGSDPS